MWYIYSKYIKMNSTSILRIIRTIFILEMVIVFAFSFSSCTSDNSTPVVESKPLGMDWLVGDWLRINEDEGKKTVELWEKKSEMEYLGIGCTTLDIDTVFYEEMRLYHGGDNWVLEITGVDGQSIDFKVTKNTKERFVAENPNNEFPKSIEYKIEEGKLHAVISDGITTIPFSFIHEDN